MSNTDGFRWDVFFHYWHNMLFEFFPVLIFCSIFVLFNKLVPEWYHLNCDIKNYFCDVITIAYGVNTVNNTKNVISYIALFFLPLIRPVSLIFVNTILFNMCLLWIIWDNIIMACPIAVWPLFHPVLSLPRVTF